MQGRRFVLAISRDMRHFRLARMVPLPSCPVLEAARRFRREVDMHKEFLMGNAAIACGALAAGIDLAAGYPGTPSTETLENVIKRRTDKVYVEWSVNEKAALELAAGASYAGARVLVTMKQVGLNVASDPLMSLEYIGVKGGMVVMVADDPGPFSSQTEQDTRHFSRFSKLPCFDPSSVQEAYDMIQDAFALSEKYGTPVLFRPTTRVCHAYASIDVKDADEWAVHAPDGFVRDSSRWVIFPRLSHDAHNRIEERNIALSAEFSAYERNRIFPEGFEGCRMGIASGGVSFAYALEALKGFPGHAPRLFKVATPYPFPEQLALEFLSGLDSVLCLEELDPVIERELVYLCGKHHLDVKIYGKLSGDREFAGENTPDSIEQGIRRFLGMPEPSALVLPPPPALPARPPVLCAGCPHRASFYAVKRAMKGRKSIFCGDIGCYTLGNAMPLDMCDTCLCMGAGINIAQGVGKVEPDRACFAFVGDSTFFASAITGIVNAVYNGADLTVVILDNSTTAMTGHQPHPGTGRTAMGQITDKVDIAAVLRGIGVSTIAREDPFDLEASIARIRELAAKPGVKAMIFTSPCAAIIPRGKPLHIDRQSCVSCRRCISELGCPAIVLKDGSVCIDEGLCTGCGLCARICPTSSIRGESSHD